MGAYQSILMKQITIKVSWAGRAETDDSCEFTHPAGGDAYPRAFQTQLDSQATAKKMLITGKKDAPFRFKDSCSGTMGTGVY